MMSKRKRPFASDEALVRAARIRNSFFAIRCSQFAAMVVLTLILTPGALASAPRESIARGNEHYAAGRYAEALEEYRRVGDPPADEIAAEALHNLAAASFRLGRFDDARELWVRAAGRRDAAFEAAARYNLGNCDYGEALQRAESGDGTGIFELLDSAMDNYRDALRLDPTLANARANLELAHRLKKTLEEMMEQQQQERPESSEQQQEEGEQDDKSEQGDDSQPTSQPDQRPPDGDPESQEENGQEGEGENEQEPDSPEPQPPSEPEPQPEDDAEPQQPEPSDDDAPPSEPDPAQVEPPPDLNLTPEEAARLLQRIRDAERQRRALLRQREAQRYRPVERDW